MRCVANQPASSISPRWVVSQRGKVLCSSCRAVDREQPEWLELVGPVYGKPFSWAI